jgi:hypothetical protein
MRCLRMMFRMSIWMESSLPKVTVSQVAPRKSK